MINYELVLIFAASGFLWSEVLTQEGMILGWVGDVINETFTSRLGLYMKKPLYSCAICVTGFWSLLISLLIFKFFPVALLYSILSMTLTKIFLRYA